MLNEILSIPPIAQGIIGSAIFWLLLLIGQKVFNFILTKTKLVSININNQRVVAKVMLDTCMNGKDASNASAAGVWCILHSLKQLIKAAIFIVIGGAFSFLSEVFWGVGIFGCVIYLFSALSFANIGWRSKSSESGAN